MNTGTVETVTGDSDSGAVRVARGVRGQNGLLLIFIGGHGTCQHCQHGIDQFWQTVTERGKKEKSS